MYATIVILGVISLLSSVLSGVITFGDAILTFFAYRVIKLLFPQYLVLTGVPPEHEFQAMVLMMSLRALAMSSTMVRLVWAESRWDFLKVSGPLVAAATLLGCWTLDNYGTAAWLHPLFGIVFSSIGAVCLFLRFWKWWRASKQQSESAAPPSEPAVIAVAPGAVPASPLSKNSPQMDDADQRKLDDPAYMSRAFWFFTIASVFAAFLGALCNVASGPLVIVIIGLEFPKALARGTLPLLFFLLFVVRFIWTSATGFKLVPVAETAAMISGGIVGLIIGNDIGRVISSKKFLTIVTVCLFLGGLSLGEAPLGVMAVSLVVLFSWAIFTDE